MKVFKLLNFRNGLATNSSSTHSVIYRNENDMFEDLDVFELDYYDRCDSTIAASRDAKIKYILANIMYNDDLVEALLPKYPEMKQYFNKIKDQMELNETEDGYYKDPIFGMTSRGPLCTGNLQYDIDYLTEVIENPDIIIVGGSDELDFVYDTVANHENVITPYDITDYGDNYSRYGSKRKHLFKNGTYWVSYGTIRLNKCTKTRCDEDEEFIPQRNCTLGRVRFSTENQPVIPQYPELIDLRLTNKCDHNCPFCFMDSNMDQPHADLRYVGRILDNLKTPTEFSIGGGNILLYPDLEDALRIIKNDGHIVNVTINVNDCARIVNDEKLKRIFISYVDGIGISVFSPDDIKKIEPLYNLMMKRETMKKIMEHTKYMTVHVIPEMLGVSKTCEIKKAISNSNMYLPMLYLGYKTNGRGANCKSVVFNDSDLDALFKEHYSLAIDTSFANTYFSWLDKNFAVSKCVTMNEGEYSLYIDGVNQRIYKSSYHLDKAYKLDTYTDKISTDDSVSVSSIEEAFACIRKDNGLIAYSDHKKKYYDNL